MKQNYTSAATSINRTRLPAVYGKVDLSQFACVLDYGCGRYTDHIRVAMPEGVNYLPYDPYNQPANVNRESVAALDRAKRDRAPVAVVCSNVLNVIDGEAEIRDILRNIAAVIRTDNRSRAYITVYEGDRTGNGRPTGPDQYQRNERLPDYLRFIPDGIRATIRRNVIILEACQNTEKEA